MPFRVLRSTLCPNCTLYFIPCQPFCCQQVSGGVFAACGAVCLARRAVASGAGGSTVVNTIIPTLGKWSLKTRTPGRSREGLTGGDAWGASKPPASGWVESQVDDPSAVSISGSVRNASMASRSERLHCSGKLSITLDRRRGNTVGGGKALRCGSWIILIQLFRATHPNGIFFSVVQHPAQ